MALHLTGTWKSINSHTYGTKFYKTHLHSRSNNQLYLPIHGPNLPPTTIVGGLHNFIGKYCPMWWCPPFSPLLYHTPSCTSLISKNPLHPHFNGAIFGKYTLIYVVKQFVLDLMKWLQYGDDESLSLKYWFIALFQHPGDIILWI